MGRGGRGSQYSGFGGGYNKLEGSAACVTKRGLAKTLTPVLSRGRGRRWTRNDSQFPAFFESRWGGEVEV